MMTNVKTKPRQSGMATRRQCHVCGGRTEKRATVCEGVQMIDGGETRVVRICADCIESRDFDKRLSAHADALEAEAALTRALIGRLSVPTVQEWRRVEAEEMAGSVNF